MAAAVDHGAGSRLLRLPEREWGEYTRVQETPFGGTVRSHSFTAQEDARYRFVVTALNLENEEGNESPPSNLVVVTLRRPRL